MKIIVCGAGHIGSSLVHYLSSEYPTVVIDIDSGILDKMASQYDVQTLCGSASDPTILDRADLHTGTHMISVTHSDEINLVACQLGRMMGPISSTMARLENPAYKHEAFFTPMVNHFQLDMAFSSYHFAAESIIHGLDHPLTFDAFDLDGGGMLLIGLMVPFDHLWIGKTVSDVQNSDAPDFAIVRLIRGNRAWIPNVDDRIQAGDALYILSESAFSSDLYTLWNRGKEPADSLIFLGYSPVLLSVLPMALSRGWPVSIVCEKEDHLLNLSEHFPSVQLIRGDILDTRILYHVIRDHQMVIATGLNENQNILATLMADRCGAQYTMAWVQQLDYWSPLCVRGIGQMIHSTPRMLTRILEKITQPYLETIYPLQGMASGAVMEVTVNQNAKIAGKSCLDWQEERWQILAICRHKKWLWNPETIEVGDRAIVTALPDGYRIFQKAFGMSFT